MFCIYFFSVFSAFSAKIRNPTLSQQSDYQNLVARKESVDFLQRYNFSFYVEKKKRKGGQSRTQGQGLPDWVYFFQVLDSCEYWLNTRGRLAEQA